MVTVSKEKVLQLSQLAKKRKNEILNAKSVYPMGVKTYYVDSIDGNDKNDGTSPAYAWRSIEKVSSNDIKPGEVVLFRRGGLWRGTLILADGVTYSAYGNGEKPKLYGSVNASDPNDWCETKYKNVWMYRPMIAYVKDVGCIAFDDGKCWGVKVCKNYKTGERCDMGKQENQNTDVFNGRTVIHRERGPFGGIGDLKNDLEFYHNYGDEHLYLYCADGNPGEVFNDIELSLRRNVLRGGKNVTVDNLCIKYTGIHAIGHSGINVKFTNCEIGFIGGSNQFPEQELLNLNKPFSTDTTRLGNGCEVYGGCDNYTVENCYFHQIYDAAITAQYMNANIERDVIMRNISWHDNLIDTSNYCFELWLAIQNKAENTTVKMENVDIYNNICLNCGYGWGSQRPDPGQTFFYGDPQYTVCEFDNVCFHDNLFAGGNGTISKARMFGGKNGMCFKHNIIFHNGKKLATHAEDMENYNGNLKLMENTDENVEFLINSGYWEDCEVYRFEETGSAIPIVF